MNGQQLDLWAMVNHGVSHITEHRGKEEPEPLGTNLDRMMSVLLEIVYDRNTDERLATRMEEVIRLSFEMGRTVQHLYNVTLKR